MGTHDPAGWVLLHTQVQSLLIMWENMYISQTSTVIYHTFIKYKTNSLVMISLNADVFFLFLKSVGCIGQFRKGCVTPGIVEVA